jgi:PilZ domain
MTVSLSGVLRMPDERRRDSRQVTVLRVAKLRTANGEELCLVRNISAGGLMAHIYSELGIGDAAVAEFKSGHAIAGRILWRRDGMVGMQFSEKVNAASVLAGDDDALPTLQQRAPRIDLEAPGRIRVGAQSYAVALCNISQGGARVRLDDAGRAVGQLVLMVNGLPPLAGSIRWERDGDAGIEFDIPVPFDVLAQWVPMAQRQSHDRRDGVASERLASPAPGDSASSIKASSI